VRKAYPAFALILCASCALPAGGPFGGAADDLGHFGTKDDSPRTRTVMVQLGPLEVKRFRVQAATVHASFAQVGDALARLSGRHLEIEVEGVESTTPELILTSPGEEVRRWTLRVENLDPSASLQGELTIVAFDGAVDEPTSPLDEHANIAYSNEFCTYGDTLPYVREVKWDHPLVQRAMQVLIPGYRSIFSYREWNRPYGLENTGIADEREVKERSARNWIRVLCGEHRDNPDLLRQKLAVVADATHYAGPEELRSVDPDQNLFTQLTYPAYTRLVRVMRAIHRHRTREQASPDDGHHYGYGESGHGSRRVAFSVAPWTHCEMRFVFEVYLLDGAPDPIPERYEDEYEIYRESECDADDLRWMYNFRGHVNFQPLWLDSNAFIFNSRRARGRELSRGDTSYYLRPYASRYRSARSAWATYLFYPEADRDRMIRASERGGGHILYLVDQDLDGDGLADYRLFDERGCGDQGVGRPVPSENCNMVSWEQARLQQNRLGHASTWDPGFWELPGMGFMQTFETFGDRMARLNQALDRHTNWGPTGYYMLDASDEGDESPRFFGVYSPIVAASYDVSASDFFVRRDYPSTHEFERGRAKWLFVMRFPAEHYYDEQDLADGRPMDFDRHYFNETSLSNDYYRERALDHWGTIPGAEAYAQVYLTYGHRGEEPPAPALAP